MKQETYAAVMDRVMEDDGANDMAEADEIYVAMDSKNIKSTGNVRNDVNRLIRVLGVSLSRRKRQRLAEGLIEIKEYADPHGQVDMVSYGKCLVQYIGKYKIDWGALAEMFPEAENVDPDDAYRVYDVEDIFGHKDVLIGIESELEDMAAGL